MIFSEKMMYRLIAHVSKEKREYNEKEEKKEK